MNSIRINILGKAYPLRVEQGEEQSMQDIADYVDERFRLFKKELSTQPEQTIMVLACLSIAEELFTQRKQSSNLDGDERSDTEHEIALEKISVQIHQILSDINAEN
jgi:cell division protein ZapA